MRRYIGNLVHELAAGRRVVAHHAEVHAVDAADEPLCDVLHHRHTRRRARRPVIPVEIVRGVERRRVPAAPVDLVLWAVAPRRARDAVAGVDGRGIRAVAVNPAVVFALDELIVYASVEPLPCGFGLVITRESVGETAARLER